MKGYLLSATLLLTLIGASILVYSRPFSPVPYLDPAEESDEVVSPIQRANEAAALHFLREINSPQELYLEMISETGSYGTLQQLVETYRNDVPSPIPRELQLLGKDHASINGYEFQLLLKPDGSDYCFYAWPSELGDTGTVSLFLYDNRVFRTAGKYSGSDNPPALEAAFCGAAFDKTSTPGTKVSNDNNLWQEVPGTE